MRQIKRGWLFIILVSTLYGVDEGLPAHSLKPNMLHLYETQPDSVDTLNDMFSEGGFYSRLRFHSFGFKWKEELETATGKPTKKDHAIVAVGGSLIYKSAILNGFSVGAGLYMTQAVGTLDRDEAYLYKSGKDALSRYDLLHDDREGIFSLSEAYLNYTHHKLSLKAGRQFFESFLVKSNDTKMIPNSFEGLTLRSEVLHSTSVKLAYLIRQKLRDHATFHHLLAWGSSTESDPYGSYSENDDGAMHRGLTRLALKAESIEDRLIVAELKDQSIENLTLKVHYTTLPELLSFAMLQAEYRFEGGEWSILPALRYMKQFDDGAGAIGGANLKTLTQGYRDANSLDATLYGVRIDVVHDAFKLRFGYTSIADEGDIVAPWRGFPTAGFSRTMGQYNWYANTKSYMVQLNYEFDAISDLNAVFRFALQDFDDTKAGVQADSRTFTVDLMKGFGAKSGLYFKTRYAHVMGDDDTVAGDGSLKTDPSYDEIRFEINYLF